MSGLTTIREALSAPSDEDSNMVPMYVQERDKNRTTPISIFSHYHTSSELAIRAGKKWAKLILAGHFGQTIIKEDDFLHVPVGH